MTTLGTEMDKAEDWVEKEAGMVEKRITMTKAYHSAEHIASVVDAWVGTKVGTLDAETAKYYSEAAMFIKGLF